MKKKSHEARRTARILLVEDYEDAREMYAELLSHAGYSVATALDGEEGLDRALSERFDLIVMDIALPKLDGLSVIAALRRRADTKAVPIIGLSAMPDADMRRAVLDSGADVFIEKPCLPAELEGAVRKLLRE